MNNTERQTGHTAPTSVPIRAAYLYGMLAFASVALAWANNEFVMTKEVFSALAGHPGDTVQMDAQFETVQRFRGWGYAIAPFQTALRVGLTALVVQMICLIGGVEIGLGNIFRIVAVAFGAVLFGSLLQIFWIAKMPATAVTQASLGIVPDSLAAWFGTVSDAPSILYLSLSRVSITSFLWMLIIYWGLRETKKLSATGAAIATTAAWSVVSALQVGTSLFVRELVG